MSQTTQQRAQATGVHGESRRGSNGGKARAGRAAEVETTCSACRARKPADAFKTCQRCREYGKTRPGREPSRRGDPTPVVRLPMSGWASQFRALEPGQSPERRDCANYDRCLASYRGHGDATCPDPCARYVEPARLRATDYTSPDGQARGAA